MTPGKYLRIDDRDALEDDYCLCRELYQILAILQTKLIWTAEAATRAKAAKPGQ